jgi:hypothetical protein
VLSGVSEGFLDDAVGGQLPPAVQRARLTLDGERHRQPGQPRLGQQLANLREPGLRGQAGGLLAFTQHPEQAPRLGQGLPAGA